MLIVVYPNEKWRDNIMVYGVLEIEIMNAIWKLQEQNEDINISVADIVKSLNNNDVQRAYTTIKTVMDRLDSKGVLVRYRSGKKFFYKSTVDKNEASQKAVEEVLNQFFDGNYIQMLRFVEKECKNLLV